MVREEKRPLKVFLCHASGDKPPVRDLYKRLTAEGVDAWLDKEKLLPGQDWRLEIPRAVQAADVVVVCLSNKSVTKEGYVQKEIKFALDSAEEKPEGAIFLIPARLEDCSVPERLSRWQWVDLYEENGFIQLLRSLKLRADAVGAAVEPSSYADSDKETERRLDQLYTEGLAAFYTEDWDRACHRFRSILSEHPGHKSAAEKLAEAERQRDLVKLYEGASEAVRSEDWQTAIKILEELSQKSADYKDATPMLRNARKRKQLKELYAEAEKLHAAQKWQAVVKVFEQISILEPNFPDVNGLLSSAEKEVAEIKRLDGLNNLYAHALREMDAGNWREARRQLEQVHKAQTGFLETERLLRKAEDEISREEKKREQNDEINTLYEQAHGLLRLKKWRNALEKLEEIRRLDPYFPDTDGIAEKAQKELAREEQEADRQNKLAAMYAEAVRLLKEEKYQEASDKWQEVKALDPKYPDRQWVQRSAKRKLSGKPQDSVIPEPRLLPQNIKTGWLILFAAIGFGLSRLVEQYIGILIHVGISPEIGWGLRGVLQGFIVAMALSIVEKGWDWKAFLTFGVGGAVFYPITFWALKQQSALLTSILLSLPPVLSILIVSLWTKRRQQWQTYALIGLGWILVWLISQNMSGYINPLFRNAPIRWAVSDLLAGAIGLWIMVDLLKPKLSEEIVDDSDVKAGRTPDSANLLLLAFLSFAILRTIWQFINNQLRIWEAPSPTLAQFVILFFLGVCFGTVVAFSLKKIIQGWGLHHSLIVIAGWAFGFGVATFTINTEYDFDAVLMVISGLSMVAAVKLAKPSISPLQITLIFVLWWVAKIYGAMLGNYARDTLGTQFIWSFPDAITVLLGLLGTLGIYEYSKHRLVQITFVAMVGFAAGNFISTALFTNLLRLDYQVSAPLGLVLWGFVGGAAFEVPSRNLKRMLINGVICAIGLVAGYFSDLLLLSKYIDLPNLLWGLGAGVALSLPSRRVSAMALLAILGSAVFMITTSSVSGIDTGTLVGNAVRGAWIGLVLGFGYVYATRDLKNNKLGW